MLPPQVFGRTRKYLVSIKKELDRKNSSDSRTTHSSHTPHLLLRTRFLEINGKKEKGATKRIIY